MHSHVRSASTRTTFLTEGSENVKFKSYFTSWPQTLTTNLYEEGRGKVAGDHLPAIVYLCTVLTNHQLLCVYMIFKKLSVLVSAIFKHQGYDVKELPDNSSQPFIDCCGDLKVSFHKKVLVYLQLLYNFFSSHSLILELI